MQFLTIPFPIIDPVLIEIGPVAIRWYSLAYIAGILLGWWYVGWLNQSKWKAFSQKQLDDLVFWIIIGVIAGGRLGYTLFYNTGYYLSNPLEIFYVWKGGMSFHGGMIGVILAVYLFCRNNKIKFLAVTDMIACAAPIGIFLGRLANFINAELYGRVTDVSWAMIFPGSDGNPRHPSQLYEAFLEGIVLFTMLFIAVNYTKIFKRSGSISGLFLLLYGVFRSVAECFREPDAQLGFIISGITMGQILSLPMIILGTYLIYVARIEKQNK